MIRIVLYCFRAREISSSGRTLGDRIYSFIGCRVMELVTRALYDPLYIWRCVVGDLYVEDIDMF